MEKMIGILLLGFFLALLLFLLIFFMGNGALNRYFESSMYRRNVSKETIAMFQEYVSRHHLAASDTERIREWAKENHIGYFTISRKRMLLYDNYYALPVALDRTKSEQLHYTWQYFQEVSFTDGNADVFIYVNRERKYYILVDVAAALCGVLVWIGVFAFGVSGYVRYIRQLSGEVAKLEDGLWSDGIAQFYQVDPLQVFVGVGSDDVLAMLFMTFFNSKKPILFPDITYSFYDVWAEMLRIPYTQIPLDDAFRLNPSDYKCENGGIVFPNPNAPTGELLPVSAIEEIIQANPDVIVLVDEAYIDFGGESALPLIDKYDNVIVVQTFSKSRSLAGSRIGFAISNPTLIKYLNDVKYSFNSYTMDRITIALGTASIRDRAYFEQTTEKIIKTREWTKEQLRALGFVFGDSKSNFIFAMHPDVSGVELFEALKKNDIYVRHFGKPARINEYLRITIGTDEQMHKLIDFLKKYLNK